jgi:hypothetical protein
MIPVGYLAKRSCSKPEGFNMADVVDVFSVSSDVNDNFADYINFWQHNGYWLFDSPEVIKSVGSEYGIPLEGTKLFFYEAYELEFTGTEWRPFSPELSIPTNVTRPLKKTLEGFDVVTFSAGNSPECSPLSCNGLADKIPTNPHCLIESFEYAKSALDWGEFNGCEPGPYRIFAVYSVDWPSPLVPSRAATDP